MSLFDDLLLTQLPPAAEAYVGRFRLHRMKNLTTRVLLLALPLIIAARANAEPWRGIIPLKSTRSDVERLLGKPLPGNMEFYVTYQLESEEVRVRYADKTSCTRTDDCECRVPDDTVLNVVVRLKTKTKFSSLALDASKFHQIVNPENPNNVAYSNADAGIIYVTSKRDDLVLYVQYGPTAKDCFAAKQGTLSKERILVQSAPLHNAQKTSVESQRVISRSPLASNIAERIAASFMAESSAKLSETHSSVPGMPQRQQRSM